MIKNVAETLNLWPHRYDPTRDEIHFIKATRDDHRTAVFLTDEYLQGAKAPQPIQRHRAMSLNTSASLHFIFHSGYCCSTLLARAFDIPGVSMGYKEPTILNDIVGWRARGAEKKPLEKALIDILALLARPFEEDPAIIVKPSCLVNVIAPQIMQMQKNSKALLLYAPLKDFLGSIARKGMWGRLWVRELMSKQLRDGMINLGLQSDDYIRLTDLQAAAICWLVQQSLFASMQVQLGSKRVLALDCSVLLKSPDTVMRKIVNHFDLPLEDQKLKTIVTGPAFTSHSKTNVDFDKTTRDADRSMGQNIHADEIEKVFSWAEIVARNARVPLTLT